MIQVFVYGTLKPGESHNFLCADHVIARQSAIVHAALYHLPLGYPAIVPGEGITYGALLTCRDTEILALLDDYEQHDPIAIAPFGSGNDYKRQEIAVFDLNHLSIGKAWAYMMTHQTIARLNGVLIPNGIWSAKNLIPVHSHL